MKSVGGESSSKLLQKLMDVDIRHFLPCLNDLKHMELHGASAFKVCPTPLLT